MKRHALGSVSVPIVLLAADRDPPAVITLLRVQAFRRPSGEASGAGEVLEFGPATWLDETVRRRWCDELAPSVEACLAQLNIGVEGWQITLRLPDAAALLEQPCRLEGPSANAALHIALIASAAGLRVRNDTLVTGAVSSADVRLEVVGGLPEKLVAAATHPAIRHFIHAPIDTDGSVAWTPELWDRWDDACRQAEGRVRLCPCEDLTGALRYLIYADSRVTAALRHGWIDHEPENSMTGWVKWLLQTRFTTWRRRLDQRLQQGRRDDVRLLLDARVRHAIRHRAYPVGLGGELTTGLRAVPRGRRRTRLHGTLIRPDLLVRCLKLAGDEHREDVEHLLIAANGRVPNVNAGPKAIADPGAQLGWLLERLGEFDIARRLDRPLDAARLCFRPERAYVRDTDEFVDLITSFYTHMTRRAGLPVPLDADAASTQALALLDRAYAREGGQRAALADARDGTHGGVRRVLDVMTDTMKAEQHRANALHAHLLAVDPSDYTAALSLTRETLNRLRSILPEKYRDLPPEQAVAKLDALIQETVQAGDRLAQRLRSL